MHACLRPSFLIVHKRPRIGAELLSHALMAEITAATKAGIITSVYFPSGSPGFQQALATEESKSSEH